MQLDLWKKGEKQGYSEFFLLFEKLQANVSSCIFHFGEDAADEYASGFLYALEDKMADLAQVIRG